MPVCPECEQELRTNASFCQNCGAAVDELESPDVDSTTASPDLVSQSADRDAQQLVDNAIDPSVTYHRLTAHGNNQNPNVPQDGPIEAYLKPDEQPHFILYNKGKGVAIGTESNTVEPRNTNLCYVVVTDSRIFCIVVQKGDDKSIFIPHSAIARFETESVFGGVKLRVDTTNGPCFTWVNSSCSNALYDALEYVDSVRQYDERVSPTNYMTFDEVVERTGWSSPGHTQESMGPAHEHIPDKHGAYVTPQRIQKIQSILDADEKIHYLTKGSTVDVQGSGAGHSLFGDDRSRKSGTRGWVRAAFTDRRVAIKIPQWLGNDERTVPYHNITSVDLDTGLVNKRISLQTAGQTYHIEAQEPGKDECRQLVRFVREQIRETQTQSQPQVQSSDPDPTEQLKNLKELHEEGVLSDEEFEEKKQSLLDDI